MIALKCKMCGGDLNFEEGVTVVECEYCGTKQTVPTIDDEKKITLFSRANRLRYACEFVKSHGVYESIVADFPEEAEAYWGLVLCMSGNPDFTVIGSSRSPNCGIGPQNRFTPITIIFLSLSPAIILERTLKYLEWRYYDEPN